MNNLLQFIVIVIITILIQIHDSSYSTDYQFANCSASYKCGDMEITYPFYGASGRPEYCGYPGFKAACVNESVTTVDILSLTYRVLTIDSTLKMVTVVRDDYYNSYCPKYLYNTTLDYKLFGYGSNYQNLSLYYTCGTNTMATANQFTCSTNNTRTVATVVTGYYFTSTPTNIELTCSGLVLVPVFSTGANNLTSSPTLSNLQTVISEGFGLVWKANNSQCDACVGSGGQCGHRVGSGEFVCYCSDSDRAYGSECSSSAGTGTGTGSGKESSSSVLLIVGIILGTFATVGIASAVFFGIRQCKKKLIAESKSKGLRTTSYELDEFIRNYGSLAPKQYKYSDVKRITKSFANKLGQGGYGSVYKGKLSDGRPVAVKILNESKGNGEDFLNEVASISRTSHVNVVCLLGFCYKGTTKRALIYEFMSNSSLDKFIHREKASPNTNIELDRTSLLKIAVGIARGLEYLHSGCNTRILHLDIKPHNILLDEDWCPKIADFGLAKLCQKKDSMVSTMPARGTIGYIAPEVFNRAFGRVSYKSDVYSYGMMILEMAGVGKSAEIDGLTETSEMYFPNWIYKKLEGGPDGVALRDNEITGEDKDKEMERKMILVGLWCIQTKPTDRPSMARVIEMLEGSTDLLQTPPKPFLFPPTSRSPTRTYSSSSLSSTSQIIDIQS